MKRFLVIAVFAPMLLAGNPNWEYRSVHSDIEVNQAIPNGWEVVKVIPGDLGPVYVMKRNANGTDPEVLFKIDPAYTKHAFKKRIQGKVLLSAIVDQTGNPTDIKIVRSLDPELDESAVSALKQWQFKPGTRNGEPAAISAAVTMTFHIIAGREPRIWFVPVPRF